MKKKVLIGVACLAISAMAVFVVENEKTSAHPGRTDSNGCHYCRTNCSSYGLSQNEYHCHNGGSTSSGGGSAPVVDTTPQPSQAEIEAQNRAAQEAQQKAIEESQKTLGQSEGYSFKMSNPNATLPDLNGQSQYYVDSYKEAFKKAETELSKASIKLADENATKDASTLEKMNLQVPSGVIESVYLAEYKDKFELYESNYLKKL